MSNLEELNEVNTDYISLLNNMNEINAPYDNAAYNRTVLNLILSSYLPSIAKSLAIIADKMSEENKED